MLESNPLSGLSRKSNVAPVKSIRTLSATTPFEYNLLTHSNFESWFEQKLLGYRQVLRNPLVEITNPRKLTSFERTALITAITRANMVIYRCRTPERVNQESILSLAAQLGLTRLDLDTTTNNQGLAELADQHIVTEKPSIPFSSAALNWHTDGYYYPTDQAIRSFLLHCERRADSGGCNLLIDHTVIYGLLRRRDPSLVTALTHPNAMTIPAHRSEQGTVIRPACAGPVFFATKDGALAMRYTSRQRHIQWQKSELVRTALGQLREVLAQASDLVLQHTLEAGEGIICHNILHARSAFTDVTPHSRLLYRARFRDPIRGGVAALPTSLLPVA